MLEIGSLVDGKYKILNKVGQGGMSVVYLAMNEKANKQWAVKEVRKDGVLDFEAVKQGLVAETDILKKLSHPNLPSIIDVIDTDESFIIIMDYIQGNSLNKALKEYGAQPQDNVIEWAKQLCDVLGYLHSRTPPIIYRDMKPSNIMLKPDGNVTLIDFGTAREYKEKNVADTTCLGTVGYAAPEQFGGMGQTDARTDIYCLGATLYHLVTGKTPCEPPYEILPIRRINPALSEGLEKIILKCTQRNPQDRYQSAEELMYALEHYEEIDVKYRSKQKKKLGTFIASAALTLVFAAVSVFGYVGAENMKKQDYDAQLSNAQKAEKYEDKLDYYEQAILIDPTRTEAYLGDEAKGFRGLIDYLSDEGIDETDLKTIQQIRLGLEETDSRGTTTTVNVMEQLKAGDPEGYQDICYEIGNAIINFVTDPRISEETKYSDAKIWFQNAQDNHPDAADYCAVADCFDSIRRSKGNKFSEEKLKESYGELWAMLKELKSNSGRMKSDMKTGICTSIVEIIKDNTNEFCKSVGSSEVIDLLEDIRDDSSLQEAIENRIDQESTNPFDLIAEMLNSIK